MSHPEQQDGYADDPRREVAPFVPRSARSALDVGCSGGGFARTLREILGADARIVGIEAMAGSAARARAAGDLDEVIEGYFPDAAPAGERFDLVTFLDVLEHMLDPQRALRACERLLTPDGRIVACIPSIQYWPVVRELLRGRWDYTDEGTLDRTHVRFFTRATMVEMFEECGYVVESCAGVGNWTRRWRSDPFPPRRWLKYKLAQAIGDARYLQFVIVARRA